MRSVMSVAAVSFCLVAVAVLLPPVRVRIAAAATTADAVGLPVVRPFAAPVTRTRTVIDGVEGDLYDPRGSAPGVVLVPGATPHGVDDPRVVRLAYALAGAKRVVFVPVLDLYNEQLVQADVDRIARAAAALARQSEHGRVALLGISFGGSLALVAAADPRLHDRVVQVAVFGAFFDLVGVIQAATTGVSLVDGTRIGWDRDPRAEAVVRDQVLELLPHAERVVARQALDGRRSVDSLPPGAQAVAILLANDNPAYTYRLASRLPEGIRQRLAQISPLSIAGRLDLPVLAMHSTDDPLVPYGELLRLGQTLPEAQLVTLGSFRHIDRRRSPAREWLRAAGDLWHVWRFTTSLLQTS
jgi:pimeloyl-ACP methyl ester carboxylesterase